uniref:PS II complex 12 kDa extrinsic protein n=1 Tax=Craspedostauros australis TaxID=1486917 RepID=A0A7R9WW70_9STRA|mmetsp:Transcript_21398/g.59533  ORF Transcript_21398/g.59533 Transcript_21398/m.59533 type:complete len:163 (+) Transcript_21398:189-677(+)|eukprot:CAMPEP_0198114000 /NCGR_PEP_ID=MMETSP1442-20131203/5516_1 /TAXON_ID= /ORGANISM="Craspedostauros australis, Strain CCMP3328" /LENGTH=162 /DNA_ID=CAMNT_0043771213 /DNA_START=160 /DNA_END=648 /DNA_ORIENTATION=+
MAPHRFSLTMLLTMTALASVATDAYQASSRRRVLRSLVAAPALTVGANAAHASKICAFGQGEACDELSEGNAYIQELQRRSSEKRAAIEQENRNAYYMKNYPDFFATVGKTMVKRPDGSFELVSDEELVELKKANKVGVEYATAMGGRVRDVTQKPFLVFKE